MMEHTNRTPSENPAAPGVSAAVSVTGLHLASQTEESRTPLVNGIDFDVAPGEAVGVIGESGSGKSLLIRSISGLLPNGVHRVSGEIRVVGADVNEMRERERRLIRGKRVGMVFQDSIGSLDPLFTVGSQMVEAIRVHQRLDRAAALAEAERLLDEVGINDARARLSAYPHELSGGMAQRVAIAIALANSPDVLIADEATTALDVTIQKQVIDLLRKIKTERGCAIIFVSHDLATVSTLVDRIYVMYQGEVVEKGPARSVLHTPEHPYTKELLYNRPRLEVSDSEPEATGHSEKDLPKSEKSSVVHIDKLSKVFSSKKHGANWALKEVSLNVNAGEWLGIVGESGSGKSTLARIVARLEVPSTGTVSFRGTPIDKLGKGRLGLAQKIQYMYQNSMSAMNPRLTATQIIVEPLRLHGLTASTDSSKSRAEALLSEVGLPEWVAGKRPGQLSGGQCQRVALARALALEPQVLLLDEPTSALDVAAQAKIIELLQEVERTRELSVVMISHDLALVSQTCHRVAVLYRGELVEMGETREVIGNPQRDYTRKLRDAVPRIE
ncbi:nickel ABC transporter ATP-binding protein NikE [Brevibacterium linens]|uniref:Peptide/nickel transport system ATP-binding protein n=1 Tax=Brevibacterium linens TaxID=1703 RepID=A0A2H1KNB3_BRELN|nr:ABC transporter ATP-binding protein [Brevibacterium linens]SMY01237.1 peptide/nickel transport system ATP-binding protein [Brevibacterium linens]